MFRNPLARKGGSPAQTPPPSPPTTDDPLHFELREHVRKLRRILPVISVSIMALHRQNAELDYDIASVLSEPACGPLDEEIELLPSLLATYASRSRQGDVRL
jgi:hypothetical protein